MNTPIYEQETIIRWYRDEERATIYTSDLTTRNLTDEERAEIAARFRK